jgi:3-oxoacyl-[acyl-carrier-protein] synthase III
VTSIEAVATYLPAERVPVADCLRQHGFRESRIRMHERFFGFAEICRDPHGGLSDQIVGAAARMAELRGHEERVRYVLHARTMPVVAPYPVNPLRHACRVLGLGHATAFSVSQHACASALLAVDLAGKLLAADGDPEARALVIAADKAFTASAAVIEDTGVMGEGAAAVLVRPDGERDLMLGYATRTDGRFAGGPWMPAELNVAFQEMYPETLADVMRAAVKRAGLDISDIALILPHNVNRMSWLRVLRLLGVRGTDRIFLDNLPRLGHCFGADSFINYESARRQGRLRRGDHYLMTSVGLGATFSAMVFTH